MAKERIFFTFRNTGIILLLLLAGSLYYDYAIFQGKDKKHLSQKFQHAILRKEQKLKELLDYSSNLNIDSLSSDKRIKTFEDDDISLFVFQNDSLIFWSNNQLIVRKHLSDSRLDNNFAELPNAFVQVMKRRKGTIDYVGISLIQHHYLFENEYLKNTFAKGFPHSGQMRIQRKKGHYPIYLADGTYLFSLSFDTHRKENNHRALFLFLLYTLSFIFALVFLSKLILRTPYFKKRKTPGMLVLLLLFVAFIETLHYFRIPHSLFDTEYFSPIYFAYSAHFSSLGNFLWNSISLFVFSAVFFQQYSFRDFTRLSQKLKSLYPPLFIIVISTLLFFFTFLIKNLIINSTIPFNLLDIPQINYLSLFGLIIFTLLIFSFVLLSYHILLSIIYFSKSGIRFFVETGIYVGLSILASWYLLNISLFISVFLLLYYWGFYLILKKGWSNHGLLNSFYFIILFSLFSNFILYQAISYKEKENIHILALHLASEKDPLLEYSFREIYQGAESDSVLTGYLRSFPFNDETGVENIREYLLQKYFHTYEKKYNFLISICDDNSKLDISSEELLIDCQYYFDSITHQYGKPTQSPQLWFIDNGFSESNYLGIIKAGNMQNQQINIYVEMFPKYITGGLGYPELLKESRGNHLSEIYKYSWARYENRELVFHSGKYFYPTLLDKFKAPPGKESFTEMDGYSHFIYTFGENLHIVISKKSTELLSILSLFSYFFIFYSIFGILLFFILSRRNIEEEGEKSLHKNMQILFITLIISSLFITAFSSLYFIRNLNDEKNIDVLSEKAHSVLIELEHKLSNEEVLNEEWNEYLSGLLYKFSLVFFSDINLYDIHGRLLVSSRPEIFEKNLVSGNMNPGAYYALGKQKRSLYIQQENIGAYHFLSAYLPLRNKNNKQIAYLNLPYFAKQDEMTNEISGFIASLINIYVILIALSIVATLLLANYITKPIRMLNNRLEKLRIGKENEKILWKRQDEIGKLVDAYNNMVDELEESARMLADSERENAWKDVARQVAHEIKNPLTPMKLSVQFLQKSWNEKLPDWDQRLQRFTETLIQQIDILENIATEFSEFAVMPTPQKKDINLLDVIQKSIQLFHSNESVDIRFHFDKEKDFHIFADPKQFHRVFTNLIKNAIQAIPPERKGKVDIFLEKENGTIRIIVQDNGKGISEEQGKKIFRPNFTTKSGGMGIGLSMTRSIIRSQNGKIFFESKPGEGTRFIIELPE